jgi:predicted O-methyltransferase YrrM
LEGCILHALAQWTAPRAECIIEIGSYRGRSLAMFALALASAESRAALVSIDPHDEEPCNLDHVRLMLRQLGAERRLVQFPMVSQESWKLLRPECASLIFIDGNHSYADVAADFTLYQGLLAPGGCLVFHDYGYGNHNGRPEAAPDVRRAVDERVFGAPGFRPLLLAHTLMAFVKSV